MRTQSSLSDSNSYISAVIEAVSEDEKFKVFRSDSRYCEILEHTSLQQGEEYLKHILNSTSLSNETIGLLKTIDRHGGPQKYEFKSIGLLSPSLLRYLSVITDILNFHGSLENKTIVEIGAGYGGQAMLINSMFNVGKYIIVDLPEPILLIKKFLTKNDINIEKFEFYTSDNLPQIQSDYLISNYAFSECCKSVQDIYIDKLINNASNFYMIINNLSLSCYSPDELLARIKRCIKVRQEFPITYHSNLLFLGEAVP